MNYKLELSNSFKSLTRNLEENANALLFCPPAISHHYRKQIESNISPINEMKKYFGDDLPIFDELFLQRVDSFCAEHQQEGIELLTYLFFTNPNNIQYYDGRKSIIVLFDNLPASFELLAFLFTSAISLPTKTTLCSIDWINSISQFLNDESHHLCISIIVKSVDFSLIRLSSFANEQIDEIFFRICSELLQSPNKLVVVNVLDAFLNLYTNYPAELMYDRLIFFTTTPMLQSEILPFSSEYTKIVAKSEEEYMEIELNRQIIHKFLVNLSNIVTDISFAHIFSNPSIINLFTNSFIIDDEQILSAAAEFACSIVSFDEGASLLMSDAFLDRIFLLLNDSPYSIRKSMILLNVDLIVSQEAQQIFLLLSRGLLESIFDYLQIEHDENTYEILQGIYYLIIKLEKTEHIDGVIDFLRENEEIIYDFIDNDCINISEKAKAILQSMSTYQLS